MRGIFSHVLGRPKAESFVVGKLTVVFNAYQTSMAFSAARFGRFVAALERLSDYLSSQNYVKIDDDQVLFGAAVSDTFHLKVAFFRNRIFVVNLADLGPSGFEVDFCADLLISGVGLDAKIAYVKDDTRIRSILDWIGEASINILEDGGLNYPSEPMLLDGHIERLTNFRAMLDWHCQIGMVNSDGWLVKPSLGRQPQHDGPYQPVECEADLSWRPAVSCLNERPTDWLIPLVYDLYSLRVDGNAFDGSFGANSRLAWAATVTGDRAVACLNERPTDWLTSKLIPFVDDLCTVKKSDGVPRSVRLS